MSQVDETADGKFEAANADLNKGLKSCRSVVNNYWALLSSNDNLTIADGPGSSGDGPSTSTGKES